jgi:putative DNA primase/helicase
VELKMDSIENAATAAFGIADNFGWAVFPVNPLTKAPLITGWQDNASSNWGGIQDLFRNYPTAAIGVVTGKKSNVIVIDLDERERFSGVANFKKAGYELSETVRTKTPSGGIHLFYEAPQIRIPNSVSKIAEGVDVRGDGGYVIVPPSITKWGKYVWDCSFERMSKGPVLLPECFFNPMTKSKPSTDKVAVGKSGVPARILHPIMEGERNDEITSRCGFLLSRYSAEDAWAMLEIINRDCCKPPLDDGELRQIFSSIRKKEGK